MLEEAATSASSQCILIISQLYIILYDLHRQHGTKKATKFGGARVCERCKCPKTATSTTKDPIDRFYVTSYPQLRGQAKEYREKE